MSAFAPRCWYFRTLLSTFHSQSVRLSSTFKMFTIHGPPDLHFINPPEKAGGSFPTGTSSSKLAISQHAHTNPVSFFISLWPDWVLKVDAASAYSTFTFLGEQPPFLHQISPSVQPETLQSKKQQALEPQKSDSRKDREVSRFVPGMSDFTWGPFTPAVQSTVYVRSQICC